MDWGIFWTIIATAFSIAGFLYQVIRNFKSDVKSILLSHEARFEKFEARFEKFEARFEMIENRIFQLAMGKSLKEILQEERK